MLLTTRELKVDPPLCVASEGFLQTNTLWTRIRRVASREDILKRVLEIHGDEIMTTNLDVVAEAVVGVISLCTLRVELR